MNLFRGSFIFKPNVNNSSNLLYVILKVFQLRNDTLGRLTSYEQAGVAKFYYFYNELNQLTSFKDPLGNWTNYKYNLDGRLITHY
ncbi:hypothetical protein BMR03_16190, partial [Methylococcaceae bacterium HT2]